MESTQALLALSAIGHAKRLAIFRLLVAAGLSGRTAGDIGNELGIPGATLSFHLKKLASAGLITAEPRCQFVCYRAVIDVVDDLVAYLTQTCGHSARKPGRRGRL